jgi:hypothetical protein
MTQTWPLFQTFHRPEPPCCFVPPVPKCCPPPPKLARVPLGGRTAFLPVFSSGNRLIARLCCPALAARACW